MAFKLLEKDLHGPPGPVKISDLLGRNLVRRQIGDVEMIFAGLLVFDADETKGTEGRVFLDLTHLLVRDVTGSKKSFGVEDLAAQVGFHFPETPVTEVDAVSRPFPQAPKQKGVAVRLQATDEKASAIVDFPEAFDLEITQVEKEQVPFHPRLRRQEGAFSRLARADRKGPGSAMEKPELNVQLRRRGTGRAPGVGKALGQLGMQRKQGAVDGDDLPDVAGLERLRRPRGERLEDDVSHGTLQASFEEFEQFRREAIVEGGYWLQLGRKFWIE